MIPKCERCGREVGPGSGRYVMTVTFTADVDWVLPEEEEETEGNIRKLLDEIERTPEDQLMDQVYHKRAFLICRPCKEELAADPLGSHSKPSSEPFQ